MRRSLWVLEVMSKNGKWGRTDTISHQKRPLAHSPPLQAGLCAKPGSVVQYRIVKYVPRDRVWWRFWE